MVVNGELHWLDVRYAKGQPIPQEAFVAWNSFSRVGVTLTITANSIVIDADAATGIAISTWTLSRRPSRFEHDARQLRHSAYLVRPGAKTLVIGAGGG